MISSSHIEGVSFMICTLGKGRHFRVIVRALVLSILRVTHSKCITSATKLILEGQIASDFLRQSLIGCVFQQQKQNEMQMPLKEESKYPLFVLLCFCQFFQFLKDLIQFRSGYKFNCKIQIDFKSYSTCYPKFETQSKQ